MKTFFAFLCGILVTAGAVVLYKEAPTIVKNWNNKPDVAINKSTTDDSATTTDESTTDDNATVQSNDESTYDDDITSNDDSSNSFFPEEITIPSTDSNDVQLPSYTVPDWDNSGYERLKQEFNEQQLLNQLGNICDQLHDIGEALNGTPTVNTCP